MKTTLKETLVSQSGNFVGLNWARELDTRKGFRHLRVTKHVRTIARIGVERDNRADVQAARASGEIPAVNQGLKGKEWVVFPTLLRSLKTGAELVRIHPISGRKPRALFRCNGKLVSRKFAQRVCLRSEFPAPSVRPELACFDVNLADLTRVRADSRLLRLR